MMGWGFVWLMFILKIPIIGLFCLVWWAVKQSDEPAPPEPARVPSASAPPPRAPAPRPAPRGPHGGHAAQPSPPRVRPAWQTAARGRPLRDL